MKSHEEIKIDPFAPMVCRDESGQVLVVVTHDEGVPAPGGTLKGVAITRNEAEMIVRDYLEQINTLEFIMFDCGQQSRRDSWAMHHAWRRVNALATAGLISDARLDELIAELLTVRAKNEFAREGLRDAAEMKDPTDDIRPGQEQEQGDEL